MPGAIEDLSSIEDDLATLGRVLFYDEKLSQMENISCASCHNPSFSFAENIPHREGITTSELRNTLHLNDLGWSNSRKSTWNMQYTSVKEAAQICLSASNAIAANLWELTSKIENQSYYPDLFDKGVLDDFQNFTESEKRGKQIFESSCTSCHKQGNIAISNNTFPDNRNNNGLPTLSEDVGAGEWNSDLDGLFKLPNLRNIELTAPYMHDGRFATLEQVINHYASDIDSNKWTSSTALLPKGGFNFTDSMKADLLNFLKTFTDTTLMSNPKWTNPFTVISRTEDWLPFDAIELRPNPMSESAVVEFKNDKNQLVSIKIMDEVGKLIKHDFTTSTEYYLDKSNFLQGIYYIELTREGYRSIQKLIVK